MIPPVDAQHGDCVWIKLVSRFVERVGVNVDLLHVQLMADLVRIPPCICELKSLSVAVKFESIPVSVSWLDSRYDRAVTCDLDGRADDTYLRQP